MKSVFCFGRLALVIEPLYFIDPDPHPGQEGPERGVRLELRMVEPQPARGSVYASQPIVIDRSIWRGDLLESVAAGPGARDRMHYHPGMRDNEPGDRVFDRHLTDDPVGWVARELADLPRMLDRWDVEEFDGFTADAAALNDMLPQILEVLATTLDKVRAGELATAPARDSR